MKCIASYRGEDSGISIEPYDIDALKQVFADADSNGCFIEAMLLEPVMGEGDPGRSVPVDFSAAAREHTKAHGSPLSADSSKSGLSATGTRQVCADPCSDDHEHPTTATQSTTTPP